MHGGGVPRSLLASFNRRGDGSYFARHLFAVDLAAVSAIVAGAAVVVGILVAFASVIGD